MENNDQIIKAFLLSHRQEIPDGGFTEGVLRRLPQAAPPKARRNLNLNSILITLAALALLLFGFSGLLESWSGWMEAFTTYSLPPGEKVFMFLYSVKVFLKAFLESLSLSSVLNFAALLLILAFITCREVILRQAY